MSAVAVPDVRNRVDALGKATGATRYSADLDHPAMLHAAVVRSPVPHALIASIHIDEARAVPGVVAVLVASDLKAGLCGRRVRDMPLLASDRVRFAGERVAVVLGDTRRASEAGAAMVEVDYGEIPAVFHAEDALASDAPVVHSEPWRYAGAVVEPTQHPNLQSEVVDGSPERVERLLAASAHVVEQVYTTPAAHQGYLEPQAWLAVPGGGGKVSVHGTTKAPYRVREQIAACLGMNVGEIDIEPTPLGGDFGGKGSPGDAAVCVAAARLTGRPVKLVLRSAEDLTSTDARHPSLITVRLGCDANGRLTGLAIDALFAGGAYAAAKPIPSVNLHGALEGALGYRLDGYSIRSRVAYTNTVPKGHMRAPGGIQTVFAVESALDELACLAGVPATRLRERNLLGDGESDAYGHRWDEARGIETLRSALAAPSAVPVPPGWQPGTGVGVYARATAAEGTSLRLRCLDDGRLLVEVPVPETGTGSHTVVRELVAARLGVAQGDVEVRQVPTSQLDFDPGVGASRVSVGMALAVEELARAWEASGGEGPVTAQTGTSMPAPVLSFCAQVARVAVDPGTGQVKVLELVTAVDVARVVNERAHQLQIDGGAIMGLGAACMEDLLEEDGLVWAANLGELKLPSCEDIPLLRTVLVEGGRGLGASNVKSVGELTNVAVAPAIANAIADATQARVRCLPLTAERVYWAMHPPERS